MFMWSVAHVPSRAAHVQPRCRVVSHSYQEGYRKWRNRRRRRTYFLSPQVMWIAVDGRARAEMEGLRASDLRRVLDFLHVLYSIHDAGEFRERLLWALHSAFPADSISLTDVDLRTHQVTGTIAPDIPMDRTKFTQHATDHP